MNWLDRLLGRAPASSTPLTGPTPARAAPTRASASAADAALPDFPFPLVRVAGRDAVAAWQKYQAEWRPDGASAVVLGDATEVTARAELMRSATRSTATILAAAASVDPAAFFAARTAAYAADDLDLVAGPWPTRRVPPSPFTAHTDLATGRPKPAVFLARVPTANVWEIPAYLHAGGWNDCPDPAEQLAVLRAWHAAYGTEIYALTDDTLECLAPRPPATREAALALAREQFLFCSDIVHQGTERLEVLAAALLDADTWFFWWD
jgi:hypothetical protein